jgi:hypothetical protein
MKRSIEIDLEVLRVLVGYAESMWNKDTHGAMDNGTSVPTEDVRLARAAIADVERIEKQAIEKQAGN